jgi:flavodoxin
MRTTRRSKQKMPALLPGAPEIFWLPISPGHPIPLSTGVDAVSSASLQIQEDGTAIGNAQQMAEWIADETGGDLYPIQTMYTYPVDYDQTVDVGEGQDSDGVHPILINPIDLSSYDLIYLVYPIWHYTLPAPIVSFLEDYDLSGKTVCCFTTSGGSGFADTIEKIQEAEPDAISL